MSASIFSFCFREIPPIQHPPPRLNNHLASHTGQPGSLPKILQETLPPGRDFCRSGPIASTRDLIVLKHSSYHLTFQCLLQSLVFNLHICWNTISYSLCSSDQLGVSLVPRGSGLCSHLSCRRLHFRNLYGTINDHE